MPFKYKTRPIDTMYNVIKIPISKDFDWDDISTYLTKNFGMSGIRWDILVTSVWNIHFKFKEDEVKFWAVKDRFYLIGFERLAAWFKSFTR